MPAPAFTTGPCPCKFLIVGESWGAKEAQLKLPFVGDSGWLLNEPLAAAGLSRKDVAVTNLIHAQPPRNDMSYFFRAEGVDFWGLKPTIQIIDALSRLKQEIALFQPEVIIALGNYAAWALTDFMAIGTTEGFGADYQKTAKQPAPTGILKRRGSMVWLRPELEFRNDGKQTCVLLAMHPAAVLRQYEMKPFLEADFIKASKGRWEPPEYNFVLRPTFHDIAEALAECRKAKVCSVDIETIPDWPTTDCIGLAWSDREAICVPWLDQWAKPYWPADEELAIRLRIRKLLVEHPCIIGQNFLYDQAYLGRELAASFVAGHDTMVTEHLLKPDFPKGLDVLSSVYCRYHRYWKDESKGQDGKRNVEKLWHYNCIDSVVVPEIREHQLAEVARRGWASKLKERHQSYTVAYRMMNKGVRVNEARREELKAQVQLAIKHRIAWLSYMLPAEAFKSGGTAWWTSPQKQMYLFYDVLGLKPVVKPATRRRTIDKNALPILMASYPALRNIFETLEELHSLNISLQVLNRRVDWDGRLKYSINIAKAKTFRWATGIHPFKIGCNMQNISKGNEKVEFDEWEDEEEEEDDDV